MDEENKRYRVVVDTDAGEQLTAHAAFLANVSVDAANRLVDSFVSAAKSLESSPLRGPWLHAAFIPANTYRYLMFEKRYALVYRVRDDVVYVDHVIDQRQDYRWLFM